MKKMKWFALALAALLCLSACSSHGSAAAPAGNKSPNTAVTNGGTQKGLSRCKACGGSGSSGTCGSCGGSGSKTVRKSSPWYGGEGGPSYYDATETCSACGGSGQRRCSRCGGTGYSS